MRGLLCGVLLGVQLLTACGSGGGGGDASADAGTDAAVDARRAADPFADRVVSYTPGRGAGFGQDQLPQVVLGPPRGGGCCAGGLDVLSLGFEGTLVLEFTDIGLVDGPGPDLLVFENPFPGNEEPAFVAVSQDGVTWKEWPCAPQAAPWPGCAGIKPVLSSPDNGISPTDPMKAGGDAFDLADLGLARARFVRIRDSGFSRGYSPPGGGFDLDAVAVVNGEPLAP